MITFFTFVAKYCVYYLITGLEGKGFLDSSKQVLRHTIKIITVAFVHSGTRRAI